jgi:capsular exopolysaccharide synthesis family protein
MQKSHDLSEAGSGEIGLHLLDYWRVVRVRLPLIILVFLLVVITAGVATYLAPRRYLSSVTMQVKEDNKMHIFNGDAAERNDPRFATTQFQIIQHKEILYPVIDTMKLMQKWELSSREMTYLKLRRMLTISEVRNTDLIMISILDKDRQEAADLANTIAGEYQKKRIDEQQSWVARSLVQLEDEVIKQRTKTENLRDQMTKIRLEARINDLNPESVEDPRQAEEQVLISVEGQVNDMRIKAAALRSKMEQIQGMTDDQIIRSLKTFEMDDATIAQIFPQYEASVSEEAHLLASGLGPNHPTVQSLRAKKEVYANQLHDQIINLRKSLASNLEISQKTLEAMELKLSEARTGQQDAKTKALSYQEAKNEYLKAKRILESAETRYSTEAMQRSMPQSPATIWEKAEISDFPAKPNIAQNMILAVVVGLVLGGGLAFLIEYLDTSVKSIQDLEAALGIPVLAVIAQGVAILKDSPSDCPDAEGYRIMRANIDLNRRSSEAKTLTIISGGAGEGKSTTLNNLAFTFAKGGYRTLIVDADLRRPSQHRFFSASNEKGLTNYLTTECSFESLVQSTPFKNLFFLPSGYLPGDEVDILYSQRMMDLMQEVKNSYDIIFFDSPPILGVSDASVIASAVDMTILVVQHRRFPKAMLKRLKQRIDEVGAVVIGSVLNNAALGSVEHYEYYSAEYYSDYHRKNPLEKEAVKAKVALPKKNSSSQEEY